MKRLIRKQAVKVMTVEQLFKEKYPNGVIYKKGNGVYEVAFNEGGKVYKYKASNNLEMIKKMKLTEDNIMYQYTYDTYVNGLAEEEHKLKNLLNGVYEEDDTGFFDLEELSEEEQKIKDVKDKESYECQIAYYKGKLDNAIVVK